MLARQALITLAMGVFSLFCVTAYSAQTPARQVPAGARCPNLTGEYVIQGEDGQVHISIQQERCDRLTIRRETGYLGTITGEKHVLILDGLFQDDPPWFGGTERYKTLAQFNDSTLHIQARSSRGNTLRMIYSLNLKGDLLEDVLVNGRGAGPIVAKRQR
jgi:hypothetical protein